MAVRMKILLFWILLPYRIMVRYQCFEEASASTYKSIRHQNPDHHETSSEIELKK
jgi:hypothetical protein